MVRHSSYGNAFHYGLSIFVEIGKCGKTFNMTEIEITDGYGSFSKPTNIDRL